MFCHCWESRNFVSVYGVLAWRKNFDLSYVRVSPALLILEYANLNVHGFSCESIFVVQRKNIPAYRVLKLDLFNLLKLMETICHSD